MAGLSVSSEAIGGDVELVKVSGDVDAHTFEDLEVAVKEVFARGRHKLILDLADVRYLSSAGAGVLVAATLDAEGLGGRAVLLNLASAVLDVLQLLGLTQELTITDNREEALALVAGP